MAKRRSGTVRIKEVSRITGLTEKTIGFYEEKQLIHPEQTRIKIFRSYTEDDIDRLKLVACLRKLDFSISDIITMQDDRERIPGVLRSYQEKNAADLEFKARVMERLKQIEYGSVSSVRDLGEYLKEIAEDRPLPEADVELQFYRIDGLTREEMERKVKDYYERQSLKDKRKTMRKIACAAALYIASAVLILIIGLLTWRNTYYLGYIPSYRDNLGWKWILIPQFGMMLGVVTTIFAKALRNISCKDEPAAKTSLRGFRTTALVLLGSLLLGVFTSIRSCKILGQVKTEAANTARQEWSELYRMADWVLDHCLDFRGNETWDHSGSVMYVNQTRYNFPYNYTDSLHTKMHDLLVSSYDLIFAESLRSRINDLADKYTEATEELFKSIY